MKDLVTTIQISYDISIEAKYNFSHIHNLPYVEYVDDIVGDRFTITDNSIKAIDFVGSLLELANAEVVPVFDTYNVLLFSEEHNENYREDYNRLALIVDFFDDSLYDLNPTIVGSSAAMRYNVTRGGDKNNYQNQMLIHP
jgi:WD40 repeat protein